MYFLLYCLGRVGSTYQLSVTFSILIGEFMNYLLIPSFDSDKCVPLTDTEPETDAPAGENGVKYAKNTPGTRLWEGMNN